MNHMTKEEFKQYLRDEYNIAPEAHRLISNILDFVENLPLDEDGKYRALTDLLDCTIGLSDNEIKAVAL